MPDNALPTDAMPVAKMVRPRCIRWRWQVSKAVAYYDDSVSPAQLRGVVNLLEDWLPDWTISGSYYADGLRLEMYFNGGQLDSQEDYKGIEEKITRLLYTGSNFVATVRVTFDRLPNGRIPSGVIEFSLQEDLLPDNVSVRRSINKIDAVRGTVLVNGGEKLRIIMRPPVEDDTITMEVAKHVIALAAHDAKLSILGAPEFVYDEITAPLD